MDILERILDLRIKHGWTEYKLAEEAGLPQSTISSWFTKHRIPSYSSLEKVCKAFKITLSQFFAETDDLIQLTEEQRNMLEAWNLLTDTQKESLLRFLSEVHQ